MLVGIVLHVVGQWIAIHTQKYFSQGGNTASYNGIYAIAIRGYRNTQKKIIIG